MMHVEHSDVIIVGGGPAGATAARTLAQAGYKVTLFEKNLQFSKPCGGGLFLHAFDEFNIPTDLITKWVTDIELISPLGKKVNVDISTYPLGIVHRKQFDSALRQLAKEAGAHIVEAKVYDVQTHSEGMVVDARTNTNESITMHALWIIAADGVNSTVVRRMHNRTPNRILTHYIDLPELQSNVCQFWFGRDIAAGYYGWVFPHYQGVNIGLVASSKKQIETYFSTLKLKKSMYDSLKLKGYYIPEWEKNTLLYEKRIFYVGDSASLVMPFTYEGIYYALKSGHLAAEAILKKDPQWYSQEWQRLYRKKFLFLRRLQRIFLSFDFLSEKMVQLYRDPGFQKAVIKYWSGSRKPSGFWITLFKILKVLIRVDKKFDLKKK